MTFFYFQYILFHNAEYVLTTLHKRLAYSLHNISPTQEIFIGLYTYVGLFTYICIYVYFLLQFVYVTVWNKIKVFIATSDIFKGTWHFSEGCHIRYLEKKITSIGTNFTIPVKL